MLTGLFRDTSFGPLKFARVFFTCGSLLIWTVLG